MRIGSRPAGKYLSASLRAAMRYVACIHGTNAWMPSIFDTLSRSGKNVRSRRASSRCCTGVISAIALLAINTGKIPCSVPVTSIVPFPALISANSRSTYGPSFSVVNWTRMPVSSVNFGSSVFLAHSCSVTGVNWFEVNTTSCAGADRAAPAPDTSMVTPSNDARRRDRITHLLDRDLRNSMMPLFGVGVSGLWLRCWCGHYLPYFLFLCVGAFGWWLCQCLLHVTRECQKEIHKHAGSFWPPGAECKEQVLRLGGSLSDLKYQHGLHRARGRR